jgi:hypothetical protein
MKKKLPTLKFNPTFQTASQIQPSFFSEATQMRDHFEKTFSNPYEATSSRFCWDYWSIPGQYRLLRTPAEPFFPAPLMSRFVAKLLEWGRNHLGCQMISHPWLSAYVDGSHQNLHSDVPHGPFSFVFSLTPWTKRTFTGGETLIAKPKLLRYFSEIDPSSSHEERDLIQSIPPKFNQLTVFDPRFPHGVRAVQGVDSILDSRLVIHGWFTEPRPMVSGALPIRKILKPMDSFAESLMSGLSQNSNHSGLLTLRIEIVPSGQVQSISVVTANLLSPLGQPIARKDLAREIQNAEVFFPKSTGKTIITLPLQIHGS